MGLFQVRIDPPVEGTSFAGETVIVTGASDGLGLEAARQFALLGATRVILAVRNTTKTREKLDTFASDPQIKEAKTSLEVFELDLDDYQSVLDFARRVKNEVTDLAILVNNAGVNIMGYQSSKSGHERVMQVNAYSAFLLALELLPLLRQSAALRGTPSHITFTGSTMYQAHSLGSNPLKEKESVIAHFDDQKQYSSFKRYPDSKVAVVAFVRELSSRVPASEVVINDFCPGLVQTNIDNNLNPVMKYSFIAIRKMVARKVEEGGRTVVHAGGVAGGDTHGKHLRDNKIQSDIKFFEEDAGKDFSRRLWEECLEEFKQLDETLVVDL